MSITAIELRRLSTFAKLPPATMAAVTGHAVPRTYRRGEAMYRTGDHCPAVFVIVTGLVRLSRPAADGEEATVAIVGQGGFLGTAAVLGHATHEDSAEAVGRVRAIELPVAGLNALATHSPEAVVALLQALFTRLDAALTGATADTAASVRARILHVLRQLTFAADGATPDPALPSAHLPVRLSHEDLARLVGARRTTVTRELRALTVAGAVVRERGHVVGIAGAGSRGGTPEP